MSIPLWKQFESKTCEQKGAVGERILGGLGGCPPKNHQLTIRFFYLETNFLPTGKTTGESINQVDARPENHWGVSPQTPRVYLKPRLDFPQTPQPAACAVPDPDLEPFRPYTAISECKALFPAAGG